MRTVLCTFTVTTALLSASYAWAQSGPIAAYSFNEGSGTTVADSTGTGVNGTLNATSWTAGKYGNALLFNGTSSYIDLGNPPPLQITGSMTVSAWIYATGTPADDGQIVAKSDSNGWQLKTSPDTGVRTFGVKVSSTQRYSKTTVALNTWYHIAGVYNASAQTLDIYVNGVLDNGTLSGTVPSTQVDASVNANIGRRTGGFYFIGKIDEVRIYNRALSQAAIQTDMNTPLSSGSAGPTSACDVNQDSVTNVGDVQLVTNMYLGLTPCTANVAGPGVCTSDVVQRVKSAALGGTCDTSVGGSGTHSVTLSWSASTSTVVGYNVYRGTTSGGPYSKITSSLVNGTSFTDNNVQGGLTYFYVATAVDSGGSESSYSNQASAAVPSP